MKIHLAADHAGFALKEALKPYVESLGHEIVDHGAFALNEGDDYPDFVKPAAEAVGVDPLSMGIVIGGSGEGEAMDANRIEDVRATAYYGGELEIVRLGRQHNDANILSLGARFINEHEAKEAVKIFLDTPFSGEARHERRVAELG